MKNESAPPIEEVVAAQMYMPEGCANRQELQLQVYRIGCNGESTVEVVSQADLLRYLNQRSQSTQPQLPPRPETYIDRTVERIKPGEDAVAVRYMDALEAENESLKARLMQVDDVLVVNWITVEDGDYREALHKLIKYNIAIHDDPAVSEVAANRKAERDKALDVIREYREDKGSEHHYCRKEVRYPITGMHDDRCPTCIKADALLSRETKET